MAAMVTTMKNKYLPKNSYFIGWTKHSGEIMSDVAQTIWQRSHRPCLGCSRISPSPATLSGTRR